MLYKNECGPEEGGKHNKNEERKHRKGGNTIKTKIVTMGRGKHNKNEDRNYGKGGGTIKMKIVTMGPGKGGNTIKKKTKIVTMGREEAQ